MQTKLKPLSTTDSFLWGVATSGYQSEGGFNGHQQPQNNWSLCERKGRVMPTGMAANFWNRYEEDFRFCQGMGLNAFRIGLEWARIQPTEFTHPAAPPPFDDAALDAYGDRLAACRRHGLEPIVTLHHFTHPAWLGLDAWLSEDTVDYFIDYVRTTVTHINRRLTDRYQYSPIQWFITINEPNMLVTSTYLSGQFPGGHSERGISAVLRAYNHMLTAHVRAYNCIHDLYEAEGWATPQVAPNTYCSDLYWSEKVLWDLLSISERQIKPANVREFIHDKAKQLETALKQADLPFRHDLPYQAGRLTHFITNFLGYRMFDIQYFDAYLQALNQSQRESVFDYVAIDYYDPFVAHLFRLPSFSDFEFKSKTIREWLMAGITSKWWDWRSLPEGLHFFCKYYSEDLGDRPIMIAENGMALRRKPNNSVATRRSDQLHRSEFLRLHLEQVQRLRAEQVPLVGYLHWSLTDNYEWGSYTPRFGLLSIDFEQGTDRSVTDHLGDRPSETYAQLIQQARCKQMTI
ncbi:glycoside hydrolase family 1 protein [Leptothermofonsia sichuanensis E412]|uniref:glycoside hydrolase family 1 protein n=1 Tax=Leptothermofonsia sichuanensis TaxID=2917832 RepID=UPI001CA75EE5|nr:family 1 glycosylhydrolase [Leptothermofonsia sichuanensis]QZZ22254.1 glycoside hydrolase family 1 protein [Leptothermofonsia sichuanensis E412]